MIKDFQKIMNTVNSKYSEYLTSPILDGDDDLFIIIQKVKPEYRLFIFKKISSLLSEKEYCYGLKIAYTKTEGLNTSSAKLSLDEVIDLFKNSNLKLLMEQDYDTFVNFPKEITVYRGTAKGKNKEAISWTTDKNRAIWFYKKYGSQGTVLSAKVKKENIICYLDESACKENEVIVNYDKLYDISELPKKERNKEIDLEAFMNGNVNTDYAIAASQAFLQKLVFFGILPSRELAIEVFKSYQTMGKYKSKYVLEFSSGEKILLHELLEKLCN